MTMVGAEKAAFDATLPLMQTYSKTVELMGGPGAGQHTKAANQIMIANNMVGVCEAFIYAQKFGLDIEKLIPLLGGGAAGSFSLTALGPRMAKRDFDPGFYVEHLHKDLGIVMEEAGKEGLKLPGTKQGKALYQELIEMGCDRDGTQALLKVFERLNKVVVEKR